MTKELTGEIIINASADKVWEILGNRFSQIGEWATVIKTSTPLSDLSTPQGADAGGRQCTPLMPFVSSVHEELTSFDASKKTFSYKATSGLPGFIRQAENTWSVQPKGINHCLVKTVGRLELNPFPGSVIYPFFRWQLNRAGAQLIEELKYYAENGIAHPRKLKSIKHNVSKK